MGDLPASDHAIAAAHAPTPSIAIIDASPGGEVDGLPCPAAAVLPLLTPPASIERHSMISSTV
jgi:hypothetical protein